MSVEAPESSAVETALLDAERKGFRLAVLGRSCALVTVKGTTVGEWLCTTACTSGRAL